MYLNTIQDFPRGPGVKNMPCNAGDSSSIPGGGIKIPHAVGQRNPCTETAESATAGESVLQLTWHNQDLTQQINK